MFPKILFTAVLFVQLAFTAAQIHYRGVYAIQEANASTGSKFKLCHDGNEPSLEIRSCGSQDKGTWVVETSVFSPEESTIQFLRHGPCDPSGAGCFVNGGDVHVDEANVGLRLGQRDDPFVLRRVPWQGANPDEGQDELFFIIEVPGTSLVWTVKDVGQKKLVVLTPLQERHHKAQADQVFKFTHIDRD